MSNRNKKVSAPFMNSSMTPTGISTGSRASITRDFWRDYVEGEMIEALRYLTGENELSATLTYHFSLIQTEDFPKEQEARTLLSRLAKTMTNLESQCEAEADRCAPE